MPLPKKRRDLGQHVDVQPRHRRRRDARDRRALRARREPPVRPRHKRPRGAGPPPAVGRARRGEGDGAACRLAGDLARRPGQPRGPRDEADPERRLRRPPQPDRVQGALAARVAGARGPRDVAARRRLVRRLPRPRGRRGRRPLRARALRGALPEPEAREHFLQLALGLHALHACHVAHLDVKSRTPHRRERRRQAHRLWQLVRLRR